MAKRAGSRSRPEKEAADALPSRDDVLAYLQNAKDKAGKREMARAFKIKGHQRRAFKELLAQMAEEGLLTGNRREFRRPGALPPVTVLDIIAFDGEGELIGEPVVWDSTEGPRPRVLLPTMPTRKAGSSRAGDRAPGIGDRVLARIAESSDPPDGAIRFEGEVIKRLPREKRRLLGVFHAHAKGGGSITSVDRKNSKEWPVLAGDEAEAREGDLVRYDIGRQGRAAAPQARIIEVLGNPSDQRQISLIAIHSHGIPDEFPEGVLDELDTLPELAIEGRTDLRDLPLLTIDPHDARDHDDAVHAAPDPDPANDGGWIVTVAIADVAYYVRGGSRLDREAQKRGNSVYFPDRVVPMLPERISNDLCSLREGVDRPCLAVQMIFDKSGSKRRHKFLRGLMRSAAKLSYQEAQAAFDGNPGPKASDVSETALLPLWRAYQALTSARGRRAPLDLDLPERKIILDAAGQVERIVVPERLDAHKLIEEFMIQANVAAAETLEQQRVPLIYRAHDQPSKEKLSSLRDFLASLDLKLPLQGTLRPEAFNRILANTRALPLADLVSEVVLRAQAQAEYTPENYGHFGLNLRRYAHFTSPIRRYADLIVHRALIRALRFGNDGLTDEQAAEIGSISEHISQTERRAMAAERETTDRLISAHLSEHIGAEFSARISGVTRSAMFVRLKDTGADGYIPASALHDDYYHYIEAQHALVGDRNGRAYRLGDEVEVRLSEAIPMAGALRFEMLSPGRKGHVSLMKGWRKHTPSKGRRHRR